MKTNLPRPRITRRGYALLLVMVFTAISLTLLTGALRWSSNNANFIDRNNQYFNTLAAADAATEKILTQITADYKNVGEAQVYSRISTYTQSVPTTSESAYWNNFQFSDGQGNNNQVYVGRMLTQTYTPLESEYSGLSGYASRYRVVANAKQIANANAVIKVAVQQEVQLASIPIFQFAIFYGGDAEFTSAAPLYIRGRVHSNSTIYTGSASPLIFYADVTSVGTDSSVARYGYSDFSGQLTFSGSKDTNVSTLSLPIGTNNTAAAVREVLNPPAAGENINSPIGQQRYYNKAELLVLVANNSVSVQVKTPFSTTPTTVPWVNLNGTANASYFISTNATFTDQRQNKTMLTTDIDVAKLITWAATNSQVSTTLGAGNPPNLIYLQDTRTKTSSQLSAVRIINAATLPSRGLTVATPHSLYTKGTFNQPNNAYLGTTTTSNTKPASLVCDAYTLLSANWSDAASSGSYTSRDPVNNTTVNAALLAGNVPSGGNWSGGVHNLPRLLEDWSGNSYTLNGSLVCLYNSNEATAQFQWPGAYYSAPTRNLSFDLNFTDPTKLPPGTPELKTLVRAKWVIPPADTINYTGN
ncbi:MAG TPA: hypothetical protein VHH73_05505 [Verrucomicrobiae bacterium]|nr:hypothetical protein [Verrucomicrobiae bacterium]